MSLDFASNQEIIQAARNNLSLGVWDYLVGASESETTMRRNRLAFDRIAFRPRVLVDVSDVDASTTFLGHKLRMPVLTAPIGSLQVFEPGGGAACARATAEFGTMPVISSVTDPPLEETAASSDKPKVFQLYVHGDWEWTKDILSRVKEAGYAALCLTVDTALYSRRERNLLDRWVPPTQRAPRDPRDPQWRSRVTWELMDRIKDFTGLPFILKGVATAEDALLAVEHGVDVVWVSNHGGRQLDHGIGTMDMLPEIVEAVDGRADVMLDGGILRGSDVLKAVALGARAVAIGKLQGWGLAAGGEAGLLKVLEILEAELRVAMGLLGITKLEQASPTYVCKAEPVVSPHEMSSFVSLPEGQIR